MLDNAPRTETFTGSSGNKLVGDLYGKGARSVILLHGGGQTRHAFAGTAQELAKAGWTALVLDQRGHGDSAWIENGSYVVADFARDAIAVSAELTKRSGKPPVLVGASLGGMAGMLAEGMAFDEKRAPNFSALVLVDVTPRFDPEGASKIRDFMRGKAFEGFATVDEAADAVAQYLPHRKRPTSTEGLRKNLRQRDGRWYWHWDPAFMTKPGDDPELRTESFEHAAKALTIPVLLIRGKLSDVVSMEGVQHFLATVPGAEFVELSNAGHTAAGDDNDAFSEVVVEFVER